MKKRVLIISTIVLQFSYLLSFSQSFDIPTKGAGISFGNSAKFTGLRFNFSDHNIEKINGINVTFWAPKEETFLGKTSGVLIGLPLTGGGEVRGISLGGGVMASKSMHGISVGIVGAGAGGNMSGINVGGIGLGTGGSLSGINIGGVGLGSGGNMSGINIGGVGTGSGGNLSGFNFGGLGLGSGGDMKGINVAGIGLGAGGSLKGISLAGIGLGSSSDIVGIQAALVGLGAGENLKGLSVAGIGLGSGNTLAGIQVAGVGLGAGNTIAGIQIAGVGIGAPEIKGVSIALVVGGAEITGLTVAPAYLQIEEDGHYTGLAVSACTISKGTFSGVGIGLFNYTRTLKGIQFGLLNYVKDNPKGLRLLPIFNAPF